jgi:hypothetical protein
MPSKPSASPSIDSAFLGRALQLSAREALCSDRSETEPGECEFGRELISLLEHSEEPLLDPYSMYLRIRRGVIRTTPLLGMLSDHEQGASFVLFNKSLTSR